MMSPELRKARDYEKEAGERILSENRPKYHLTPRCGWMNDPNGFSFYEGRYHLFYQYYPYASKWGTMHWGHAVSKDLLHWEYLPCALAPDVFYDRDGCFSGSAVTLPDGRHCLFYTGVTKAEELQVQCLAFGDGTDYVKYEENPVISESLLPKGAYPKDFRDPKLLLSEEGGYELIVSSRAADGNGQLLLYRSEDLLHWEFVSVFLKNNDHPGVMWECPDLFSLDGKEVLIVSPMAGQPEAMIGHIDREKQVFVPESIQRIDPGSDFYAPQTVLSPDGRRILIGWMQNWDSVSELDPEADFICQMTLPRELRIEDGTLKQYPLREAVTEYGERKDGEIVFFDRYSVERFHKDGTGMETRSLMKREGNYERKKTD